MALNFPANPTLDQVYTSDNLSWKWDGVTWKSYNAEDAVPINPVFTYTSGRLTSIAYGGGESKTFTYTSGLLTRLDFTKNGVTIRKTFNYTLGILTSITQVTL
jgi:hypothetical protein